MLAQHPEALPPNILGRSEGDDDADERATTRHVVTASAEYVTGAVGDARVDLFRSTDREDRGGVVLRFTIRDSGSSFVPHAVVTPTGVDLHLCGEGEAEGMLLALASALKAAKKRRSAWVHMAEITTSHLM